MSTSSVRRAKAPLLAALFASILVVLLGPTGATGADVASAGSTAPLTPVTVAVLPVEPAALPCMQSTGDSSSVRASTRGS